MAGERGGVQQRLRQPVAQGGVQWLALIFAAVDFLGEGTELVDRAAAQPVAQRRLHKGEMVLGAEQGVAAGDTRQDHIHAVAERDLAVLEQQHDRDRLAGLDDARKAGADGLAGIGEAVGLRTGFNRGEVAVEKAGPPANGDHIGNIHPAVSCAFSPHPSSASPRTTSPASGEDHSGD